MGIYGKTASKALVYSRAPQPASILDIALVSNTYLQVCKRALPSGRFKPEQPGMNSRERLLLLIADDASPHHPLGNATASRTSVFLLAYTTLLADSNLDGLKHEPEG